VVLTTHHDPPPSRPLVQRRLLTASKIAAQAQCRLVIPVVNATPGPVDGGNPRRRGPVRSCHCAFFYAGNRAILVSQLPVAARCVL